MKNLIIRIIRVYQRLPFRSHSNCKYIPTCSNYAIDALNEYGLFKGSLMAIKRILKCNPFSKGGIDIVKRRNIWKE